MHEQQLICSDTYLRLLCPIEDLKPAVREHLLRWFGRHDLAPAVVDLTRPIERDEFARSLAWRETNPAGDVVRRWRYQFNHIGTWPEPFPASLPRLRVDRDPNVRNALLRVPVDTASATYLG